MEPIPQIPKALEIIENVQKIWEGVWVNKIQCKRVADRFKAIGELLRIYGTASAGGNRDDSTLEYPAFEELLIVLQKGQALVSKNVKRAGIRSHLTWSNNREAFQEIHKELETMKAKFPFDAFGDQFETASGSQRYEMLTHDANEDTKQDLEIMKSLPDRLSYLHIDFAEITIKAPVRDLEILSQPAKDDFWAMVCEGSWLGYDYAVKVFKSKQVEWNKDQMTNEVGALMELRHPHIVPIVGFAQGPESCAVLMELMPERDLRHFIKNHAPAGPRPFTRSQELDIITQIARGMLYLHTRGYVHGDLKCSNILMKKYGDYIEVKIGDLRFAEKLQNSGRRSTMQRARWTPLEALENYGGEQPTDDLRKQADVYSFAMTCNEIITGKLPFQDIRGDDLIKMIKGGQRPDLPEDLGLKELKGLIGSCWDNDPNARPAFEEICISLETIRSLLPAVTNKSSGNIFIKLNAVGSMLNRLRSVQSEPTTTWNGMSGQTKSGQTEGPKLNIPECPIIKHEALKKVGRVGRGSYAKVYEVIWLGCTVAVKRFKRSSLPRQELNLLIQLRHPCIIQLVGVSEDHQKGRCFIVMEFMRGSLRDLINSRTKKSTSTKWKPMNSGAVKLPFKLEEEVRIITKLAQGMAFLHSRGVAHLDLKASNVMCQEHSGYFDVKIVDFGVSELIPEAQGVLAGSGYWRAPEMFPTPANLALRRSREFVNLMAADVYSFAMTCYEIVTGLCPFQLESDIHITTYDEVQGENGRRPELPSDLNAGLKDLIKDCWHPDPRLRPAFANIWTRLNDFLPHW